MSVGWLVCWSVLHNFLKVWEVTTIFQTVDAYLQRIQCIISAPIYAMEVFLEDRPINKKINDQPTNQPTDHPTDGREGFIREDRLHQQQPSFEKLNIRIHLILLPYLTGRS